MRILNCPFCGSCGEFVTFKLSNGSPRGQIRCVVKGCQGRAIAHHWDEAKAIQQWNKRSIGFLLEWLIIKLQN